MQLAKNLRFIRAIPMIAGVSALIAGSAAAENRYGADRDLGYEVYNMKKELDTTRGRVTKLEQEITKLGRSVGSSGQQQVSHNSTQNRLPVSNRSSDGSYHRVGSGDTLSSIARQYQVGVDRLVAENRITNPNALRIGQEVFIPGRKGATATPPKSGSSGTSAPVSGSTHTVSPGDTLFSIGRRFGVSADAIVRANGMRNPNALRVGQRLSIPGGSNSGRTTAPVTPPPAPAAPEPPRGGGRSQEVVAPDGYGFYQVEPGDTMHSIAISFGTNDSELKRLNDLRTSSLQVGDFLLVPVPDDSLYEG